MDFQCTYNALPVVINIGPCRQNNCSAGGQNESIAQGQSQNLRGGPPHQWSPMFKETSGRENTTTVYPKQLC